MRHHHLARGRCAQQHAAAREGERSDRRRARGGREATASVRAQLVQQLDRREVEESHLAGREAERTHVRARARARARARVRRVRRAELRAVRWLRAEPRWQQRHARACRSVRRAQLRELQRAARALVRAARPGGVRAPAQPPY